MDHRTETRRERSPITAWLRNEHAGARYDEPYPSGEPVPSGAEELNRFQAATRGRTMMLSERLALAAQLSPAAQDELDRDEREQWNAGEL